MLKKLKDDSARKAPDSPKKSSGRQETKAAERTAADSTTRTTTTTTSSDKTSSKNPTESPVPARRRHNSTPSAEHKKLSSAESGPSENEPSSNDVATDPKNEPQTTSDVNQNEQIKNQNDNLQKGKENEDAKDSTDIGAKRKTKVNFTAFRVPVVPPVGRKRFTENSRKVHSVVFRCSKRPCYACSVSVPSVPTNLTACPHLAVFV